MVLNNTESKSRPNIVFILIDDMGWMDLSCQGSKFYETPNIDKLAAEGIRFTEAYAPSPVCSPTRAALMTGKNPARVGITQWIGGNWKGKLNAVPYLHYLPHSEISLARALKEWGYATYHVGKWHLGEKDYWPETHGFDVNIAGCHWGHPWNGYFSPYNIPTLENGPKGEYLTDRLTQEAITLLERHVREKDAPFFLNMWYYAVHTPIQVPEEEIDYFKEKAEKMGISPDNPDVPTYEEEEIDFVLNGFKLPVIQRRRLQNDPKYAGMIRRLDKNIGRLLETLKRLGISKNTIVIFYSDNGGLSDGTRPPTSNLPLRNGKSYMYEGGIRTPLIIRWPGVIEGNRISNLPITAMDLYPTILDMVGHPPMPEQHVDGKSFYPHLIGSESSEDLRGDDKVLFWHYPHYNGNGAFPASAVRKGPYKLIHWYEDDRYELFNLEEDLEELRDISNTHPEVVEELKGLLSEWIRSVKAKIPEENPEYPLYFARKVGEISGILKQVGPSDDEFDEDMQPCPYLIQNARIGEQKSEKEDTDSPLDIPLGDVLEEFVDKTINLNVNGTLYTGLITFSGQKGGADGSSGNSILVFQDLHAERAIPFGELLGDFINTRVRVRTWDDFDFKLLRKKGITRSILPQLEIVKQ